MRIYFVVAEVEGEVRRRPSQTRLNLWTPRLAFARVVKWKRILKAAQDAQNLRLLTNENLVKSLSSFQTHKNNRTEQPPRVYTFYTADEVN